MDSIQFDLDGDGFLSQQCPSCDKRFKIKPGFGADGPIQHCPYCDHSGQNCWWTAEQAEYIQGMVSSAVHVDLNEMLSNSLKGLRSVTFKAGPEPKIPATPVETDEGWPIVEFPSAERIKHDGSQDRLRCPVTGIEITL